MRNQNDYETINNKYSTTEPCTIGFLTERLSGEYQTGIWHGIKDAAQLHNINVVCMCGGSLGLGPADPWNYQGNVLYSIFEKNPPDGLLISGSIGNYISDDIMASFLNKYAHIPVLTLSPILSSIPAVCIDNRHGTRSLLLHLIEFHHYKKFAFIRGPEGNIEAEERFQHFVDILDEKHIALQVEYLFRGDFTRECGAEAARHLINSASDIDVIVAADDETALGALFALQENGLNVPHDVAIVGFNDIEEGQYITPPLTTVKQPLHAIGQTSVEMMLKKLRGEAIANKINLKAKVLIRQSCGCFYNPPDAQRIKNAIYKKENLHSNLNEKDVFDHVMAYMDHSYAEQTREIISCFCKDVNERKSISFLKKVDRIGRDLVLRDKKLSAWHYIFFELWYYALTNLNKESFAFADDILHLARVIRGEVSLRELGIRRIQTTRKNNHLHTISDIFQNTLNVNALMDKVGEQLPLLGLNTFFISLYDSSENGLSPDSHMVLAYVKGKRIDLSKDGVPFKTDSIIPDSIVSIHSIPFVIVESLYFQEEQYGLLIFQDNGHDSGVFAKLCDYISSALHSAYLLKKVLNQAETLGRANEELEKLREKEHAYLLAIKNELELGRKIQLGFLPQEFPNLPGWEIAVAFSPAREVSGDFYDVFVLDENSIIITIADVSGKDVSAALFMALVRSLLRVFSERAFLDGQSPLRAIEVVNNYIIKHHRQGGDGRCMFATIIFGVLNPNTGEFTYINAGHNSPYVIKDNTIQGEIKPTGPAVGLAADLIFKIKTLYIEPGEMVFTYTDGVTEAQNPQGEFFTSERLIEVLKQQYTTTSQKVQQVDTVLHDFIENATPFDDITMLALKRK